MSGNLSNSEKFPTAVLLFTEYARSKIKKKVVTRQYKIRCTGKVNDVPNPTLKTYIGMVRKDF